MAKAILLARVSTQAQDYQMQINEMREVATKLGYDPDHQIEVKGKESAIKLDEEQRQTLQEMKELIEGNPEVNHVFVYAIDRLARRVSIVLNVKDWLTSKGINLTFLHPAQMSTLQADGTPNPATEMSLMMLAYGAQQEMTIKQARFQSAKRLLREAHKKSCGICLYGYRKGDDKFPKVFEDEAKVVREVFELVAEGKSSTKVNQLMVEKGYWPATARKYSHTKVMNIVRNPAYKGGMSCSVQYPAIVGGEVWQQANDKMTANRCLPKTQHKHRYYSDGGLVWSVSPKTPMSPKSGDNTYSTSSQLSPVISVNIDIIDYITAMTASIYIHKLRKYQSEQGVEKAKATIAENKAGIEALDGQVAELERRKDRAFKAFTMGGVDDDKYQKTLDSINSEIAKFKARQVELEQANGKLEDFINRYKEDKDWYRLLIFGSADFATQKSMIREVIKRIWIERTMTRHYTITVELTDVAKLLEEDENWSLEWQYCSEFGKKTVEVDGVSLRVPKRELKFDDHYISLPGALNHVRQLRENS